MKTVITIEPGHITVQLNDNPAIEVPLPEDVTRALAPTRTCEVCGADISHRHVLSKICEKPECRLAKQKELNARYNAKSRERRSIPKPSNTPVPQAKTVQAVMDELRAGFDDPWDCSMCRNAGSLCILHERMASEGKTPPKIRTEVRS